MSDIIFHWLVCILCFLATKKKQDAASAADPTSGGSGADGNKPALNKQDSLEQAEVKLRQQLQKAQQVTPPPSVFSNGN